MSQTYNLDPNTTKNMSNQNNLKSLEFLFLKNYKKVFTLILNLVIIIYAIFTTFVYSLRWAMNLSLIVSKKLLLMIQCYNKIGLTYLFVMVIFKKPKYRKIIMASLLLHIFSDTLLYTRGPLSVFTATTKTKTKTNFRSQLFFICNILYIYL